MRTLFTLCVLSLLAIKAQADIRTQVVEYRDGDTVLEGFLAWDDTIKTKRPGILICHQWMGLTDYEKGRAQQLAKLGYVAFALDIYGKGVRPKNSTESRAQSSKYKGDRNLLRQRANAGLTYLKSVTQVDTTKTAAIGYCFGGTTVLELARSGAEVNGVVSFHGGLGSPTPEHAKHIKGKVLICHGAVDPKVPASDIKQFYDSMEAAKVDYVFISYADAVHAFTQPMAGNDPSNGVAYNAKADTRSWGAMRLFLDEIF